MNSLDGRKLDFKAFCAEFELIVDWREFILISIDTDFVIADLFFSFDI